MADVSADDSPDGTRGDASVVQAVVPGADLVTSGGGVTSKYKMIGMDAITDGLYDTWVVIGAADPTGASYAGGLATPLRDIAIASSWTV